MQLSDKKIKEFQALFLQEYGEEISEDDARERGERLCRWLYTIYKPDSKIGEFND